MRKTDIWVVMSCQIIFTEVPAFYVNLQFYTDLGEILHIHKKSLIKNRGLATGSGLKKLISINVKKQCIFFSVVKSEIKIWIKWVTI